jgi:heme-degrading monooxygenase HmoA
MQHLRLATYEIKDSTFEEVADAARSGMLRTFQKQPGFVRYGLADVGNQTCVSISLWDSRKSADAAVPVAAAWVRENLGDKIEIRSNQIGDVAFFEGALSTV